MTQRQTKSVSLIMCIILALNATWAFVTLLNSEYVKTEFNVLLYVSLLIAAVLMEMAAKEAPYLGYVSIALPVYIFTAVYPSLGGWPGAIIMATIGITARSFIVNGQPIFYKLADLSSSLLAVCFAILPFNIMLPGCKADPGAFSEPVKKAFASLSETGSIDASFIWAFILSAGIFWLTDVICTTSSASFIGDAITHWNKVRNKIRFFYFISFSISFLAYVCAASCKNSYWSMFFPVSLLAAMYFCLTGVLAEEEKIDTEEIAQNLAKAEADRDKFEESYLKASSDLNKKVDEISVIHEMNKSLASCSTMDEAASIVMSMIRKFVRYQTCILFLVNKKGQLIPFKSDSPYANRITTGMMAGDRESIVATSALSKSPSFITGEEPEGEMRAGAPLFDTELSAISVPFFIKKELMGVLYIGSNKKSAYSGKHMNIFVTLMISAAISIESVQLYEEKESSLAGAQKLNSNLEKALAQAKLLNEFGKHLVSTLKTEEILDYAASQIEKLIEYETLIIFSLPKDDDGKAKIAVPKRTKGPYAETLAEISYNASEGMLGWVISNRQPVLFGNKTNKTNHPNLIENEPSSLIVPMVLDGEVTGIVYIGSDKENTYNENSLNTVSTMAYQTAMALKNADLYEKMVALAITDGLTGLYTHRYFKERLAEACKEYERTRKPFSLIMIDTDNFKNYNDTLGHPEGDKLLKAIATIIKKYCRDTDIVARYGGDEFAVVLKESDKENSVKVAERIREAFANAFMQNKVRVTASLGVASFPEDASSMAEFLEAADKALYQSKNTGRNKVTQAPSAGGIKAAAPETKRMGRKSEFLNKTKELSPAQLLEIRQSYMQKLQSQPTILKEDNETKDGGGRFHIPDAGSQRTFSRSNTTQVFNPALLNGKPQQPQAPFHR